MSKRRFQSALAVSAIFFAVSAQAKDRYTMPDSCQGILTAQLSSCEVQNFYRCDGDPTGFLNAMAFGPDGILYYAIQNADGAPVIGEYPQDGVSLIDNKRGPDFISSTVLMTQGLDRFDFEMDSDLGTFRAVGQMRLTGETKIIDGRSLDLVESELNFYDPKGALVLSADEPDLFDRELRWHFDTLDPDGLNKTPREFIYSGEPGFLTRAPKYDCGVVTSQNTSKHEMMEVRNDQV